MKRQLITSSVFLLATLAAVGCGRDEKPVVASETPTGSGATSGAAAEARDQALVRVVNAIPGTASVDVFADQMLFAPRVAYGTATQYTGVSASADDFAIRAANQPPGAPQTVLAENSEGVMGGHHYTLVVFPGKENDRAELQVVTDNHEVPDAGQARVRLINAATGLDSVDVFVPGTTDAWMDDVDFREVSSYKDIDLAARTVELRTTDGKRVVAKPNLEIQPGKSYTIVVTASKRAASGFDTLVIEDQVVTQRASN